MGDFWIMGNFWILGEFELWVAFDFIIKYELLLTFKSWVPFVIKYELWVKLEGGRGQTDTQTQTHQYNDLAWPRGLD